MYAESPSSLQRVTEEGGAFETPVRTGNCAWSKTSGLADDVGTASDNDDDTPFVAKQGYRLLGGDVRYAVFLRDGLERRHAGCQLAGVDPSAQQRGNLSVQRDRAVMINRHPGSVRFPQVRY